MFDNAVVNISVVNAAVRSKEGMMKDVVPLSCGRSFISFARLVIWQCVAHLLGSRCTSENGF